MEELVLLGRVVDTSPVRVSLSRALGFGVMQRFRAGPATGERIPRCLFSGASNERHEGEFKMEGTL